ncbi:hypothetical protein CDAR_64841 [Caerostris darwini]|uniref:Ycf15 n=1 Tax=Caerostris darwini TaxID=1538125 RepID=A0AAV4QZB5_9ARAC|nr:hypothetical protein CDAR_64841 [Caerostris darwini]
MFLRQRLVQENDVTNSFSKSIPKHIPSFLPNRKSASLPLSTDILFQCRPREIRLTDHFATRTAILGGGQNASPVLRSSHTHFPEGHCEYWSRNSEKREA